MKQKNIAFVIILNSHQILGYKHLLNNINRNEIILINMISFIKGLSSFLFIISTYKAFIVSNNLLWKI
jgi:hypothetical protein